MHRVVQDQIERMIAQKQGDPHASAAASAHLADCAECREEMQTMEAHARLLRQLRPPQGFDGEPRAGFYARVMERIEAEGPVSIWNLFMESPFGRRIAVASLAFAVVLGVYLVSSEHQADDPIVAQSSIDRDAISQGTMAIQVELSQPQGVMDFSTIDPGQQSQLAITGASFAAPADDAVLSNLMTYREQ